LKTSLQATNSIGTDMQTRNSQQKLHQKPHNTVHGLTENTQKNPSNSKGRQRSLID